MNCLTDSICSPSNLFELIDSVAATIDYAGALFFGGRWEAIGPDVALHTGALKELLADFFAKPPGDCQRYASLGAFING